MVHDSSYRFLALGVLSVCAGLVPPAVAESVRFAAIGDYGRANVGEAKVDTLVTNWNVDFIITTGGNYNGNPVDIYIGPYYHEYIGNYVGGFGAGAPVNRFFPTIGYTDYTMAPTSSYLAYFTLPGTGIVSSNTSGSELYYDFTYGPIHFFALDNSGLNSSGIGFTGAQGVWLQNQLGLSSSPWKIVYMNQPPYSSSRPELPPHYNRWPFEAWGADVVIAGADNTYDRIMRDDNTDGRTLPYLISGLGANKPSICCQSPDSGSTVCYCGAVGSLFADADDTSIIFRFMAVNGTPLGALVDSFMMVKPSCCRGATGNVDCDAGDGCDISDLSALIDFLYITFTPLCCDKEANIDGDPQGGIDISDLSALIDYLYISFAAPSGCQ